MRRTTASLRLVTAAITALVVAGSVAPAHADDAHVVQTGEAEALAITFVAGGAGASVPTGISRARTSGIDAKASANVVDWAILATLVGAIDPSQWSPVPLPFDSGFPDSVSATSDGPHDAERDGALPFVGTLEALGLGPIAISAAHEEAHATPERDAWSKTTIPSARVPGVFELGAISSAATIRDDESVGSTKVTDLVIGPVELHGLEWRAVQHIGDPAVGTFALAGVTIDGERQALDTPGASADALSRANDALAPIGVRIELPVVTDGASDAAVSPLVIHYGDAPLTASLLGPVYEALSPFVIEAFNALQSQIPELGYALFGANIVLATLFGFGDFEVQVGGVKASLAEATVVPFTPPPAADVLAGAVTAAPAEPVAIPLRTITSPPVPAQAAVPGTETFTVALPPVVTTEIVSSERLPGWLPWLLGALAGVGAVLARRRRPRLTVAS